LFTELMLLLSNQKRARFARKDYFHYIAIYGGRRMIDWPVYRRWILRYIDSCAVQWLLFYGKMYFIIFKRKWTFFHFQRKFSKAASSYQLQTQDQDPH